MKIIFIFSCSGMFRHVPECSIFRVLSTPLKKAVSRVLCWILLAIYEMERSTLPYFIYSMMLNSLNIRKIPSTRTAFVKKMEKTHESIMLQLLRSVYFRLVNLFLMQIFQELILDHLLKSHFLRKSRTPRHSSKNRIFYSL